MKLASVFTLIVIGSVAPIYAEVPSSETIRIPGKVDGFGALPVDNIVNGALVLKSFRPSDLTQFRIEHFIAPNEPLKAGPQTVSVPGNFYVPRQAEDWGFFRVQIEKPEYGYYTRPGDSEEVIATSFKAPFSQLLDLAQAGRTSPSQLLPLVSMDRFDFKPEADYSRASRLDFQLSKRFVPGMNFSWSRTKVGAGESDHVFSFQATPKGRWILSDIVGNAPAQGQLKKAEGFPLEHKVLFARLKEVNNNLNEIRAVVSTSGAAQGVPPSIANARLDGNAVLWDPVQGNGWMSVVTERRQASTLKDTFLWFFDLAYLFDVGVRTSHSWVDPRDGSFVMMPPDDGSDPGELSITLAFVGTDRPVAHPDLDPNNELFEHMNSMVVKVLR